MIINWWQITIIGIVVFVVGFFIRQWTMNPTPIELHPIEVIAGVPDTVFVPAQPIVGMDSSIVMALVKKNWHLQRDLNKEIKIKDSLLSKFAWDSSNVWFPMYQKIIDIWDPDSVHVLIRSRTYILSDTSANMVIEWNIQPRPCETIQTTDTAYVPKMVYVEIDPPFYEKPGFIAPVTAIGTYILVKVVESLFGK